MASHAPVAMAASSLGCGLPENPVLLFPFIADTAGHPAAGMGPQRLFESSSPADHREGPVPRRHEAVSRAHDSERLLGLGDLKNRLRVLGKHLTVDGLNLWRRHVTDRVIRETSLAPTGIHRELGRRALSVPAPSAGRHERPGFLDRQRSVAVVVGRREALQPLAQLGLRLWKRHLRHKQKTSA